MKLPISWVKEYVDIEISMKELEEKLFSSGFEVEEVKYLGEEISNCVVGQITKIEKHPDSDHLLICKLNCGSFGKNIQIVTGANNVFEGAKVPVALNGSTLHNGIKIKNGKLRGVESNGMLCSGEELGITEDFYTNAGVNGILILPKDTKIGEDIKNVVGLNDYIFDISITANRPDCQSIYGMVREISAILKLKKDQPQLLFVESQDSEEQLSVENKAFDICPKYLASIVENVKVETSPVWLRQRLIKCDVNPINNIVDITNYILLELGQPMHAFDKEKLMGDAIIIRRAKHGEIIKTLDEKQFELNNNNLVIADAKRPVALAGIMGGFDSGVSDTTKTIVFESAKFFRDNIRKSSRALGQSSASSLRYEKGVDEYTTQLAMKRALNLISILKCGKVTNLHFNQSATENFVPQVVSTTYKKINDILGIVVPKKQVDEILNSLDFKILPQTNNVDLIAEVPPYRSDIDGTADLAEEIIRIYGYQNIPPVMLENTKLTKGGLNQLQKDKIKAKDILKCLGFNEIVTYSFYGEKDLDLFNFSKDAPERNFIRLKNPLTEDIEIMRTILAPSMLSVINKNIKKTVLDGRFFELAKIYLPKELPLISFPIERLTLSLGVFGDDEDFFSLKGYLESFAECFNLQLTFEQESKRFLHLYRSANICINNEVIGFIGQVAYEITQELSIDKPIFLAEINFEKFLSFYSHTYNYKEVSKYLDIERDLAIVVEEKITSGEIENIIKTMGKKVSKIKLFDIYRGNQLAENHKSMAYRITFTPTETPITHEEVDNSIKKILKKLNEQLNATIRV